jgi:hypothetical protein
MERTTAMIYTSAHSDEDFRPSRATGWVGWIFFAACMMVLSGTFNVIWGIVALVRDEVFVQGPRGNVINLDYVTWGWVNLIFGIAAVAAGFGLFVGATWAYVIALVMAGLSVVDNLLVIGAYPIWSTIVIAFDILVIWAITVHGREMRGG